ncbi:hypothetical protein Ddye_019097 [Dipteronia dyeriana]|uniref:RNase H type-1 domain-containing protein n=1 Tax=Dipteronia dyeriana TaxID=168575 RepID=A0AAD9TXN2_9ROSI|nr:hypothetical protein Ddye_019097 [Dipteronia dyeriana]
MLLCSLIWISLVLWLRLETLLGGLSCTFFVESAEVLALREGLVLAKQLGYNVSWAEVDAVNVAAGVNLFQPLSGVAGFVFDDVQALCKEAGISKCHAISRKGNGLAHNLASLAVSSRREQLWQGNCPVSLF